MRLFTIFLIFLPFIFLEATVFSLPVSLIFVFSISMFSVSSRKLLFCFLAGVFYKFFLGSSIPFYIWFLTISGMLSVYQRYFPNYKIFSVILFLISEIGFYKLLGFQLDLANILTGLVIFIIVSFWVKSFLVIEEENQLQFDFILT